MYMEDAIRATVSIMEAPKEQIKIRTSYNLAGFSFSPADLAVAIKKHIPDFEISYKPDFRNDIAATWPASIDDSRARQDWGWKPNFTIEGLVEIMLRELKTRI